MSGLHHSVTTAFGVSGIIREKGYYKTMDGTRMIRKTKDGSDQVLARHQIIEHCVQAGYPWMDQHHLSQSGKPCVFAEGENYIMTDLIRYREADFSDPKEFIKIIESVAKWHSCARGVPLTTSLCKGRPPTPLTEEFKAQGEALDAIRKRIRKQSKWSDFDVLFLKNYPGYREQIQRALKLLESTSYLKRCQKARQMGHICHGGLKEDCIRIQTDRVYITKLDQASIDYQLIDLCGLIRRREKRQKDLERSKILEAYDRILLLEPEEEVIIEAMLLYPLAFIKIVTEYYQKKRTWTPIAMINKMKDILSNEGIT